MFKKIKKQLDKNHKKTKEMYASSISAMFTSVLIGVYIGLTTNTKFSGWKKWSNFGWIQYLIFIGFILIVGKIFFYVGNKFSSDEYTQFNFKINFWIGLFMGLFTATMIIYYNDILMLIILACSMGIAYLFLLYFLTKIPRPK